MPPLQCLTLHAEGEDWCRGDCPSWEVRIGLVEGIEMVVVL